MLDFRLDVTSAVRLTNVPGGDVGIVLEEYQIFAAEFHRRSRVQETVFAGGHEDKRMFFYDEIT
jgi:hypothetical protein